MQDPYKHWSRAWNHMHRASHKYLMTAVPNLKGDPPTDPTKVIIQDTMSRIYEQLEGLCILHALALEMFKNLQPTNNFDTDYQGPPPYLDSLGVPTRCHHHQTQVVQGFPNMSQHHYSQMLQKHTLRCQHHLTKIAQKFPIKC